MVLVQGLIDRPVAFVVDCPVVEDVCEEPAAGNVILLEDVEFRAEEEGKTIYLEEKKLMAFPQAVGAFRKVLANMADVLYVNDACGTAHRAPSPTFGEGRLMRALEVLVAKKLKLLGRYATRGGKRHCV